MSVIDEIAAERKRQIEVEGWDRNHDRDHHGNGELACAAAAYCVVGHLDGYAAKLWPWDEMKPKSPRRNLIRAAALIVAEIERLDMVDPRYIR